MAMLDRNVLSLDSILEAVQEDDNIGLCIKCGNEQYGVEPDARGYECDECEEPTVYGAPELLITFAQLNVQVELVDDDYEPNPYDELDIQQYQNHRHN